MNEEYVCSEENEILAGSEIESPEELHDQETPKNTESENIEALKKELEALRAQVSDFEAKERTETRLLEEISDFKLLFPGVRPEEIPESVWESARKGTNLLAAYALYEKRIAAEEARIAAINATNASRSPGAAGKYTASEYFTPDDVRKMSRAEVHANYAKIKESMKKWINN